MNFKNISYLFFFLFTVSCSEKVEPIIEDNLIPKTRYTFSQCKEVDFVVSGGAYQILYDNSSPIDTIFAYSGAFNYGKDSIIYLRIRKDLSNDVLKNQNDGVYYGVLNNLVLYTGETFRIIDPPLFHSHYSSFLLKDNFLFYWGFENFEHLYACKYNLQTKKNEKIRLSEPVGTDYFGVYLPPTYQTDGTIEFSLDGRDQYWTINNTFDKIINVFESKKVVEDKYESFTTKDTLQKNTNF